MSDEITFYALVQIAGEVFLLRAPIVRARVDFRKSWGLPHNLADYLFASDGSPADPAALAAALATITGGQLHELCEKARGVCHDAAGRVVGWPAG